MAIPADVFFQSFLAGLASIISPMGFLILLIVIVLCLLSIFVRARIFARLAMLGLLVLLAVNLYFVTVFPGGREVANAVAISTQVSGSLLQSLVEVLGKGAFNFGLILVPLLASLVTLQLIGSPSDDED
jgi:hypothetical protein